MKTKDLHDLIDTCINKIHENFLDKGFSLKDSHTLSYAYSLWYLLWSDFLKLMEIDFEFLWNPGTIGRWANSISALSPSSLFIELEGYDSEIRASTPVTVLPVIFGILEELPFPGISKLRPLLIPYCANSRASWFLIQEVRTLVCFLSRLNLESTSTDPLEKWLATEERLKSLTISDWDLRCLQNCAGHLAYPHQPYIQLSTGSTADAGRGVVQKCSSTAIASRYSYRVTCRDGYIWPVMKRVGDPISKLFFVPKSWKTTRSIVMEPAYQAWLQNAYGSSMASAVYARWGSHANPMSPTHNRTLVRNDRFSTIDLSEASDSVRWDVALAVSDEFRSRLKCSRSEKTLLPTGAVHSLVKAAGMGNAWTFPLEGHVFASIVELARRRGGFEEDDFAVFGDDIIVPNAWYDSVMSTLSTFGFIPNMSKSYSGASSFRESCGHDYFFIDHNPVWVTPLRLSRRFDQSVNALSTGRDGTQVKRLLGLVPLADEAHLFGYRNLYRFLSDVLRRNGAAFSDDILIIEEDRTHKTIYNGLYSPSARGFRPPFKVKPEKVSPRTEQCLAWALMSDTREIIPGIEFSDYPWVTLGQIN